MVRHLTVFHLASRDKADSATKRLISLFIEDINDFSVDDVVDDDDEEGGLLLLCLFTGFLS